MFYLILFLVLVTDVLWCALAVVKIFQGRRWVGALTLLFGLLQIAGLGVLIFSRGSTAEWAEAMPRWLLSAVLVWHLLLLPPWLSWQLARGLSFLAKRFARVLRQEESPSVGLTRRQFLGAAAAFTPPLITVGASAFAESELDEFRIRRVELPLAGLPPELDGMTIAHVTDTHVGRFTRGRVLERIVEETNKLDVDVVALTGDLINDSLRAMPPALEMVRGFRARHGIVTCEGNHDLIEDAELFYRQAELGGLPLLRNEVATMTIRGQKVQWLGLPWRRRPADNAADIAKLREASDPAAWRILLAHHPHAWDVAEEIPLTLAGHTHGGQLMLSEQSGFGPWFFKYWSGVYRREGQALFVSNGTGNWFPVRIKAPAEIVHLTLRSGRPLS